MCGGGERPGDLTETCSTRPLILGIGGTTRAGSSSERALLVSLQAAERDGAQTVALTGAAIVLPMYAPEKPERSAEAEWLIDLVRRCDGMIIASPGYHGTVSGLIKNALDYIEDLRADSRVYLHGRAVGCIGCAYGWQGAASTLTGLRSIVHALRGWPTPMGAVINTAGPVFDEAGACVDASARFQLELVGRQVTEFARLRMAGPLPAPLA
jgi:FMN reductase